MQMNGKMTTGKQLASHIKNWLEERLLARQLDRQTELENLTDTKRQSKVGR